MPIAPGVLEEIDYELYDTVEISRREQYQRLFSVPLGQTVNHEPKQYTETNLLLAGQLPMPQKMVISKIYCTFLQHNKPLRLSHPLWWGTRFELNVCGKRMWDSLTYAVVNPIAVVADGDGILQLRETEREKIFREISRKFEISIDHGMSFECEVEIPLHLLSATFGIRLLCSLIGKLTRATL